jgi:hypothetical protein
MFAYDIPPYSTGGSGDAGSIQILNAYTVGEGENVDASPGTTADSNASSKNPSPALLSGSEVLFLLLGILFASIG